MLHIAMYIPAFLGTGLLPEDPYPNAREDASKGGEERPWLVYGVGYENRAKVEQVP